LHGLPVRRSVRLRGFDYRSVGAYFITICTYRRACIFAEIVNDATVLSVAGEVVESGWRAIPRFSPDVGLDLFVVMPNHVHGILVLGEGFREKHSPEANASPLHRFRPKGTQGGSISAIVQTFKATTTRRVRSLPGLMGLRLWQRGFYDHVIRDDEELNRLRYYIEENPLRWGLDEENPQRSV